jgi:hypothetical protein
MNFPLYLYTPRVLNIRRSQSIRAGGLSETLYNLVVGKIPQISLAGRCTKLAQLPMPLTTAGH